MSNQELIGDMICFVCELFDANNIVYWIDFGTLLGIVREGDIIKWDSDGDISIFKSSRESVIKVLTDQSKYKFRKAGGRYRISPLDSSEPWIDIYIWKDNSIGEFYESAESGFPRGLYIKCEHIKQLCRLKFRNKAILAPKKYRSRLIQLYGDYMTPVKRVPYWR